MATPSFDPNTTPLSLNPSGAPPNFVNPESQAPTVLSSGLVLIILSTLCVCTRWYSSLKSTSKLHLDDYCAAFGLVGAIAYWAIIYSLAKDGWGRHSWDVPLSFLDDFYTNRQFASQILISPVKFAITSAIIILYVRLFGTLKWVRITSYFLYVFLFLIQVQNIGIALYWYIPRASDGNNIQAALMRTAETGASAIVNAACSTVIDIVLFMIPFIIVPSLNMSRKKRRAFYAVFLFGILIIVADCVGIAYKTYGVLGKKGDPFWIGMISIITVYAETFALIIISCIPGLSAFYVGTFMKTRFYSSLQYGLMYRMRRSERSERSNLPSVEDDTNRYNKSNKSNKYNPSVQRQPNSLHSTKSLVGSSKNIYIELEPTNTSNASPYSTLGKQENGQMGTST
ncbi:Uncharacterized protein BP5553_05807 [Venustampulla echinocandica]|uniref:Rhodopsin domain-containing protein n=1 Tax=Venustampulla echinocandica TaxID=2656787 RepID=A0A370TLQ6_9HELO|nr:Uncharacterized protein BP5553_05807 [Venustampulla echinocandica]RDL36455.1 Uncharacterized protein BP5553_05807 [Venustampulla echinocandica]